MLASLLPGLRDLRTPLATGYLWLIALWLVLHDYVPRTNEQATGSIRSIYELGQLLGPTAVLAAVSFVAYILGTMLTFGANRSYSNYIPFSRLPGRPELGLRDKIGIITRKYVVVFHERTSLALTQQLRTFIDRLLRETSELSNEDHAHLLRVPIPPDGSRQASTPELYVATIVAEFPAISVQLQAKNRDYWDTYDRQSAEAQFRFCIAPPLYVVLVLASLQSSVWWVLLLVAPTYLIVLGFRQVLQSASTLVQAVVLKMVEPPIIERLEEAVAKKEQRPSAD